MSAPEQVDRLCEVMHDAYGEAAAKAGWETQERSRKPWADVPEANKAAMRHAVHALVGHLLLNEGMRPPARTVSTVEELDALPIRSIVREDGGTSFERLRSGWDCLTTDGSDGLWASSKVAAAAPLTVIYQGGE